MSHYLLTAGVFPWKRLGQWGGNRKRLQQLLAADALPLLQGNILATQKGSSSWETAGKGSGQEEGMASPLPEPFLNTVKSSGNEELL